MVVLKCANCHAARIVEVVWARGTEPPIAPCECGETTWFIADAKTSVVIERLGGNTNER